MNVIVVLHTAGTYLLLVLGTLTIDFKTRIGAVTALIEHRPLYIRRFLRITVACFLESPLSINADAGETVPRFFKPSKIFTPVAVAS